MKAFKIVSLVSAVLLMSFGMSLAATDPTTLNLPWEPVSGEGGERFEMPWWGPGEVHTLLYSTLVVIDDDLIPRHPGLAESWEISEDGLTYTFHLRKNVKWHDGVPFTAEDVRWNYTVGLLNPRRLPELINAMEAVKGAQAYMKGEADSVEGIEVLDDHTIRFTLSEPNGLFLAGTAKIVILPPHHLKHEDPARIHLSEFFMKPIGTGPYKIAERNPTNYTVLVPFEDYFEGTPKIERIVLRHWDKIVPAAAAGEVDFGHTNDIATALELMKIPHMKVTPVSSPYLRFLAVKVDEPPMNDVRVRKALLYAIDREEIIEQFFEGYAGTVQTNMYPSEWVNDELIPYEYNPEKARQLLAEAEWDPNYVIDLIYYYNSAFEADFLAAIQYYWEQVGVRCVPRLITGDATYIIQVEKKHDIWYGASTMSDPTGHFGRWRSDVGSASGTCYNNPYYDELVKQAARESKFEIRKAIFDELQAILHEDAVILPLYSPMVFAYEHERVERPWVASDIWWAHRMQWEKWELKK